MFRKTRAASLALAAAALLGALGAAPAEAAFTFSFSQGAGYVAGNGSGSIDTASLAPAGSGEVSRGAVNASLGMLGVAEGLVPLDFYTGIAGPPQFGHAGLHFADRSDGTGFTFQAAVGMIGLPQGYVSRTGLGGHLMFLGESFASLGLVVGTFVYSWGSGDTADSFTVQVLAPGASIPEPGSLLPVLGGLLLLALARRQSWT
ncbi:PEP-CTERM sorting domain-containing protein [Roseomonas sp. AR75]|uniref:PEP-CTERM sorting domain-containing protein n=1 Tax=Roseomonas sp. AR75 TaxID=2562311 RepID=UPI0010C040C4|nr:PEP-CTERM sorting domain-containing protein [Roseomonas sp. AR75]